MSVWFEEIVDAYEKRCYKVEELLLRLQSPYQLIEIYKLYKYGITLVLDGHARVFQADEFIFHEAMIHPIMHFNGLKSEEVLLIGDGDGGSVREILKYGTVERLDWVEIDSQVVQACETYLPTFPANVFNDKRLHTYWENGLDYISKCQHRYANIYVSVTEYMEGNVSQPFYSLEVLEKLANLLAPNGICVQSAGVYTVTDSNQPETVLENFSRVFKYSVLYSVGLPSFGIDWAFCVGSNLPIDLQTTIPNENLALKYYSSETHNRMFTHIKTK